MQTSVNQPSADEGLQVDNTTSGLQPIPKHQPAPEATQLEHLNGYYGPQKAPGPDKEVVQNSEKETDALHLDSNPGFRRGFWQRNLHSKRKRWLIPLALLAVVVVVLAIALPLGLQKKDNTSR